MFPTRAIAKHIRPVHPAAGGHVRQAQEDQPDNTAGGLVWRIPFSHQAPASER